MNSGCYNSWQWWNASIPSWWHSVLLCPSLVPLLWLENSALCLTFPKCQGLADKLLPFTFSTTSNKRSQKLPQVVHALEIIIIYWISRKGVCRGLWVFPRCWDIAGTVPALTPLQEFEGWSVSRSEPRAAPKSAVRWLNSICVQPNPIYLTSLRRKKKIILHQNYCFWNCLVSFE